MFSRRPVSASCAGLVSPPTIAGLSMGGGPTHMFVTAVLLPFFAGMTMLTAVPTGVKFFNWIGTHVGRLHPVRTRRCCSAVGLPSCCSLPDRRPDWPDAGVPPPDFHVSDSYFVVAHFHYVLMGGSVSRVHGDLLPVPLFTGRRLSSEGLGKAVLADVHRPT